MGGARTKRGRQSSWTREERARAPAPVRWAPQIPVFLRLLRNLLILPLGPNREPPRPRLSFLLTKHKKELEPRPSCARRGAARSLARGNREPEGVAILVHHHDRPWPNQRRFNADGQRLCNRSFKQQHTHTLARMDRKTAPTSDACLAACGSIFHFRPTTRSRSQLLEPKSPILAN